MLNLLNQCLTVSRQWALTSTAFRYVIITWEDRVHQVWPIHSLFNNTESRRDRLLRSARKGAPLATAGTLKPHHLGPLQLQKPHTTVGWNIHSRTDVAGLLLEQLLNVQAAIDHVSGLTAACHRGWPRRTGFRTENMTTNYTVLDSAPHGNVFTMTSHGDGFVKCAAWWWVTAIQLADIVMPHDHLIS